MIEVPLRLALVVWLGVCAYQDLRTRTVSNWLTLPLFFVGLAYAVWKGGENLIAFALGLTVFGVLWLCNGAGAADVKVISALAGIWPDAFFLSLAMILVWSLGCLLQGKKGISYAGIPPVWIGAVLALIFHAFG